jgi:DnaK suppressor protein
VSEDTSVPPEIHDTSREELEAEESRLEARLGELHADDLAETQDDNFADGGQVAAEQDEIMALASDLRTQLEDVQRALGKLDAGTYGICEACGERIGDDRLEAMPAARFCMLHAAG